jgi:chromosome segregation ATPase
MRINPNQAKNALNALGNQVTQQPLTATPGLNNPLASGPNPGLPQLGGIPTEFISSAGTPANKASGGNQSAPNNKLSDLQQKLDKAKSEFKDLLGIRERELDKFFTDIRHEKTLAQDKIKRLEEKQRKNETLLSAGLSKEEERELTALRKKVSELELKLEFDSPPISQEFKSQIDNKQEEVKKLEAEIEKLKKEGSPNTDAASSLPAAPKSPLQQQIDALKNKLNVAKGELKGLNEIRKSEYKKNEDQITRLQKDRENVKAEMKIIQDKKQAGFRLSSKEQETLRDLESRYRSIGADIGLALEVFPDKTNIHAKEAEIAKLEKELAGLEAQLSKEGTIVEEEK